MLIAHPLSLPHRHEIGISQFNGLVSNDHLRFVDDKTNVFGCVRNTRQTIFRQSTGLDGKEID